MVGRFALRPLAVATAIFSVLLLLASPASAVTLRGQVGTNHVLREFFFVGPGAHVTAEAVNASDIAPAGTIFKSFIRRDGSFGLELPDPEAIEAAPPVAAPTEEGAAAVAASPPMPSQVYLLKLHVRALHFDQYRVDVRPAKRSGQPPVISIRPHNPLHPISASLYLSDPLPSPFMPSPHHVLTYHHSIQDFNALNYLWMTLKSPVILMSLGAWAMVSLMPKLMASLDPEEQAQMARNQAQMADRMSALQSGDWKSLTAGDSPSERVPPNNGAGAKKRK